MNKRVYILLSLLTATLLLIYCSSNTTKLSVAEQFDAEHYDERFNFYVVADGGRNGYYKQQSVADQMGEVSEVVEPEFVVSAGDTHHYNGVTSVSDPLWMTNFEYIYSHPKLLVDWYPVLGNHEYRGNTQAVIDYSRVSRRWEMEGRYYTKVWDEAGTTLRLVFVDTAPLIDKYREEPEYIDAPQQSIETQLEWVDSVLYAATEEWIIVVGHHPIYAYTTKSEKERIDMQNRLDPILRKHSVDMYICGHIHSFQHLRAEGSDIDYIVNGSASLGRDVESIAETQFCAAKEGFLIVSAGADNLEATMVDYDGQLIHTVNRSR